MGIPPTTSWSQRASTKSSETTYNCFPHSDAPFSPKKKVTVEVVGFEKNCHSRAQQPNHRARRTRACCALCLRASHTLNHGHEDKATLGYVERQQDTWVGCANDFGGDSISDAPSSAAGAHEMFCRTAVLSIGQVLDDSQATIPSMRGGQVFFLCGVVELPRTVECVENRHSPGSLPVSIACSLICVS